MSVSEASLDVAEKTLDGFFTRLANNNESLGAIETRMDALINRLKGIESTNSGPSAEPPHGILPRLSEIIGDNSGSISRIEDLLTSLEDIA